YTYDTPATWYYVQSNHTHPLNVQGQDTDGSNLYPLLNDVFPDGYMMQIVKEVGDPVSWSYLAAWNSYKVGNWSITNFPLRSFWKPGMHAINSKYDFLGHCAGPLDPAGGQHQTVYFTDFASGKTSIAEVYNMGPASSVY